MVTKKYIKRMTTYLDKLRGPKKTGIRQSIDSFKTILNNTTTEDKLYTRFYKEIMSQYPYYTQTLIDNAHIFFKKNIKIYDDKQ